MPAYYSQVVRKFIATPPTEIFGELSLANRESGFSEVGGDQSDAWKQEIEVLQRELSTLCQLCPAANQWGLLLEFPIPRRGLRIDAVLLTEHRILILEFKSSSQKPSASARQVEDYGLDLSYFHAPSHGQMIVPIVVSRSAQMKTPENRGSNILSVGQASPNELAALLRQITAAESGSNEAQFDLRDWNNGQYEPVPSVIEAATRLYAGMSVREITRTHTDMENLTRTTEAVLQEVAKARLQRHKVICFITGIPGAGKTLAGLNLAHSEQIRGGEGKPAVFMSGNRPLVIVLREALARDFAKRNGERLGKARSRVKTLIQNIHHFIGDNLLRSVDQLPYEHTIVFDEAQRAWSTGHNQKRHRERRSPLWHISEPEMLLNIMDRHKDWAVIIALVGGGQEIHKGEAGLAEWGKALASNYQHWKVVASSEALNGGETVNGTSLFRGVAPPNTISQNDALHLRTCVRSHQAQEISAWVNRVIEGESAKAADLSRKFEKFPIVLTRDLADAKNWLLENTRGYRRCGLIASSGATRLRAHGIETSSGFRRPYPYDRWFLDDKEDYRSSYQLEVPATEFEIQGLEIDVACLCWGGDFAWSTSVRKWRKLRLVGLSWRELSDPTDALQVENKYRVLMTRSREGFVIFVPEGNQGDSTCHVAALNDTAEFLLSCGVRLLPRN